MLNNLEYVQVPTGVWTQRLAEDWEYYKVGSNNVEIDLNSRFRATTPGVYEFNVIKG